jgi:hypothetical protein
MIYLSSLSSSSDHLPQRHFSSADPETREAFPDPVHWFR